MRQRKRECPKNIPLIRPDIGRCFLHACHAPHALLDRLTSASGVFPGKPDNEQKPASVFLRATGLPAAVRAVSTPYTYSDGNPALLRHPIYRGCPPAAFAGAGQIDTIGANQRFGRYSGPLRNTL